MPLAAHARFEGRALVLDAVLGDPRLQGPLLRAAQRGEADDAQAARALGTRAAAALRAQGGGAYLEAAASMQAP